MAALGPPIRLDELRQRWAERPPRLWVVGDVMLDRYVLGAVDRVSPEAPVPVLRVAQRLERAGGAANAALNARTLGATVALGGLIGDDEPGARLCQLVRERDVTLGGCVRGAGPTTTKLRALAGAQQLLRIDEELRAPLTDAQRRQIVDGLAAELPQPDVVLVSDYDKGVVSSELMARLAAATTAPIFVDPKGRDYRRYVGAAAIMPNEREAQLASGVEIVDELTLQKAATRLHELVPGAHVIVTRGARGMTARLSDGSVVHRPARARQTFDVTGAGDSAIAALVLGRAAGLDWPDALHVANLAGGIAVGKIGAAPVWAEELFAALGHEDFSLKLVDRRGLGELRRTAEVLGQRLVFTNGCFDLLHVGHLKLLQAARAMGDHLVVAVNSDESVRRLKGAERPIVGERERALLLTGLESVGSVTLFAEDTPLQAILACRPDVLVKGGDYTVDRIVGAREVQSWGGEVRIVPTVAGHSTSDTVAKLRRG
jgi:D-beta-D-heptose 7-phosphate kinase/D-beta-D-heptose 1-phosphate adenosyltransferase